MQKWILILAGLFCIGGLNAEPPLFYWDSRPLHGFSNFGDALSPEFVERMAGHPIEIASSSSEKKFLALGSILHFAKEGDLVWGAGINGKYPNKNDYRFNRLDIRAVRGPLTRKFLMDLGVECPEVYGDPTLLLPRLFPEFRKVANPSKSYILIPHYADEPLCAGLPNVVSAKEEWREVVKKILDSEFVISSALSGIIVAEAFGIPARLLRLSEKEDLFKYADYYYGTGRLDFRFATSVEEALQMGGEPLPQCDLEKLYRAFPFDRFEDKSMQFLEAQREIYKRLRFQESELEKIRLSGAPLVQRWQQFLQLILPIQMEVIKEFGFEGNQAGLSAFNEQFMRRAAENKTLRQFNERKWNYLLEHAFGLKEVRKITVEQARSLIKDIGASMASDDFLQKVDEAMARLAPGASLVEKRKELLTLLLPLHMSVMGRHGFEGEAGYVQAQKALIDYYHDPEIMEAAAQAQKAVFAHLK